ncbi:MAG: hypothetical protein FWD39_04070 [Clostridiales bacterium]|nr:hypothetical protein [Clostridiales bacterium]
MKKRKYPASFFVGGVFLSLIRYAVKYKFLTAAVALLFIIRIFIPAIPIMIPLAVIILGLLIAVIDQCKLRRTLFRDSGNEDFEGFKDRVFGADNAKNWRQNTINWAEEAIKNHHDDDDT